MTLGLAIVMLLADTLISFVLAVVISILKNGKGDGRLVWNVARGKLSVQYLYIRCRETFLKTYLIFIVYGAKCNEKCREITKWSVFIDKMLREILKN